MGKHEKKEDLNQKPFDKDAPPDQKAKEFDDQYSQNQGKFTGVVERRPRRHAR